MSDELRAAAERVLRVESGERSRIVYGFDDEEMDDFMYRMLENAATRDLKILAVEYAKRLTAPLPDDLEDRIRYALMSSDAQRLDPEATVAKVADSIRPLFAESGADGPSNRVQERVPTPSDSAPDSLPADLEAELMAVAERVYDGFRGQSSTWVAAQFRPLLHLASGVRADDVARLTRERDGLRDELERALRMDRPTRIDAT